VSVIQTKYLPFSLPSNPSRRQKRALAKLSKIPRIQNKIFVSPSPLPLSQKKREERKKTEQSYVGHSPIRSNIFLEKLPFKAIIDSGSSLNIINEEIFKFIQKQSPHLQAEQDHTIIEGLSGSTTNLGKTILQIQIGPQISSVEFHILKNTRIFVLLGVPTLKLFGIKLDFQKETLEIGEDSEKHTQLFT